MWQTGDGRFAGKGRGGRVTGNPRSAFERPRVIPLLSVAARTVAIPPITYWENTATRRGNLSRSRESSTWNNLSFSLKLRNNNVSLFCEPLPPLDRSPEFMEISWPLEGVQVVWNGRRTGRGGFVDLRISSLGTLRVGPSLSVSRLSHRWTSITENLGDALRRANGVMELRIVLERGMDLDVLRSFVADAGIGSSGSAGSAASAESGGSTGYSRPERANGQRHYSDLPALRVMRQEPVVLRSQTNLYTPSRQDLVVARSQANRHTSRLEPVIPRSQAGFRPPRQGPLVPRSHSDPCFPSRPFRPFTVLERRPQTNPHLDPNVYDPFPGRHVPGPVSTPLTAASPAPAPPAPTHLALTSPRLPSPAETSQALAELQLSDGGNPNAPKKTPPTGQSEPEKNPGFAALSRSSSSSAWSFLAKSGKLSSTASSSSSSSSMRSLPRTTPIMVSSESEPSDMEVASVRSVKSDAEGERKKKQRSGDAGKKKREPREARKRKRRKREVVVELSDEVSDAVGEPEELWEEEEQSRGSGKKRKSGKARKKRREQEVVGSNGEAAKGLGEPQEEEQEVEEVTEVQEMENEAPRERKKKRKETKKKRKAVSLAIDRDVRMADNTDTQSIKKKKKKKKKQIPEFPSPSPSPQPATAGKKKRKKGKHKATSPPSSSEPPSSSKSLKRKRIDLYESDNEEAHAKRERLRKRIMDISLQRHELRVEEQEVKAMLNRLELNSRKQDGGHVRANCFCSACGKYGHRRDSHVCVLYYDRR